MKPRSPTTADYKALRRLAAAAGTRQELGRWIDEALREGKGQSGRKAYADRFNFGTLERLLGTEGKTRTELIRQLVRNDPRKRGTGIEKSAIDRVRRKLRVVEMELDKIDLSGFADFIRARIKSQQPVKRPEYTCPSVAHPDGRFHDTPRGRAPSPTKRTRKRQ